MRRILFVIPALEYGGAAKQMYLLATGLPRTDFEIQVCALGRPGPVAGSLDKAGLAVYELGWNRWIDLKPLWDFRQLLSSYEPEIIHAWRLPTLRAIRLLGGARHRVVASAMVPASRMRGVQAWLALKLLQRADRVTAQTASEAEQYRRLGLAAEKIALIPAGVSSSAVDKQPQRKLLRSLSLGDETRLIVCVGPFTTEKGYIEAIWAFDILHYLYDNLHLVLIGSGPYLERLARYVHTVRCSDCVHFLGPQPDVNEVLVQADVVWVPGLTRGGVNAALEAMAAGRPVVASRLPALVETIEDRISGFLVPAGDKVALARQTRVLLDDPQLARHMAERGRKRALKSFGAESLVERYIKLYEELATGASHQTADYRVLSTQ